MSDNDGPPTAPCIACGGERDRGIIMQSDKGLILIYGMCSTCDDDACHEAARKEIVAIGDAAQEEER